MPLLDYQDWEALYGAWKAVHIDDPGKDKYLVIIRIPPPRGEAFVTATYMSFQGHARYLAKLLGISLLGVNEHQIPRVQFGDPVLPRMYKALRSDGTRALILDAPTGVWR